MKGVSFRGRPSGVRSSRAFPYPQDTLRVQREIVTVSSLGFHTWTAAVVRDPQTGLLVTVTGSVGVTSTPIAVQPRRLFPWHFFSAIIPGGEHATPGVGPQDPVRICATLNRQLSYAREQAEAAGRRIVVSGPDLAPEDVDYRGPFQRESPARRAAREIREYAEAAIMPIGDVLFTARLGEGADAHPHTVL